MDTTNSFSFLSPFLQRPSTPFLANDIKKHGGNYIKKGSSTPTPITAVISAEEKQVANVIASSIIKESQTQIRQQSSPGGLNVNIREASYADLLSVSSLRVNVFYPELITNGAFHTRILEKLRKRKNDGAVCLVALEKEGIDHNPPNNGYRYEHVLGTVEFSPNDFKNTSMENIGDARKLYAMDLAIRKSARRYGLATRLLHSIEIYAANHNYCEVYLHVEAENEAARYLYKNTKQNQKN
jgi:ribosomal protein S18 acetylase RimI-like enzyme